MGFLFYKSTKLSDLYRGLYEFIFYLIGVSYLQRINFVLSFFFIKNTNKIKGLQSTKLVRSLFFINIFTFCFVY